MCCCQVFEAGKSEQETTLLSCAGNLWGIECSLAGHDSSVVCEVLCVGGAVNPDTTLVSCGGKKIY